MADVVIIGGGVVGAACAFTLARDGASVVLLERSELAAGASGRNHGVLFRPADPALLAHFEAGYPMYREIAAESDLPIFLDETPLGFLVVYDDEKSRETGAAEAELAASVGCNVETLDANQVHEAEPALAPSVSGGFLIDDGIRLDPSLLTVALARAAAARGAEIRIGANARAIITRGMRVRGVAVDTETIPADAALIAAGPWTPAITSRLGLRIPVHGARGWIAQLGPAANLVHHIVEYGGWHLPPGLVQPAQPRVSDLAAARVIGDANVLVHPASGDTYYLGGSRIASLREDAESPEIVSELAAKATTLIPSIADIRVMRTWSGVRPMSPDGKPLTGALPIDGLYLATGHGSQGVILAGGTALVIADLIAAREPSLPFRELDPARFRER